MRFAIPLRAVCPRHHEDDQSSREPGKNGSRKTTAMKCLCKTPHIDQFARTAVRLGRACCQAVCCNPSRSSFPTGLRPLTTRVLSSGHVMDEHLPAGIDAPESLFATHHVPAGSFRDRKL